MKFALTAYWICVPTSSRYMMGSGPDPSAWVTGWTSTNRRHYNNSSQTTSVFFWWQSLSILLYFSSSIGTWIQSIALTDHLKSDSTHPYNTDHSRFDVRSVGWIGGPVRDPQTNGIYASIEQPASGWTEGRKGRGALLEQCNAMMVVGSIIHGIVSDGSHEQVDRCNPFRPWCFKNKWIQVLVISQFCLSWLDSKVWPWQVMPKAWVKFVNSAVKVNRTFVNPKTRTTAIHDDPRGPKPQRICGFLLVHFIPPRTHQGGSEETLNIRSM